MRIGLALPHYDFSSPDGSGVTMGKLIESARLAERLGLDSVWVSDHFYLSLARYGGPPAPRGSGEPLAMLAALATVTERVRLGTLVLSAGFRHPAILAKAATTIDLLSNGRFDLGLGAGWYEDEYRAFGYDFGSTGERFAVLEETVEVLVRLWRGDPASWSGSRFTLREAYVRPRPEQRPHPPILIGGKGGPRLLELVAARAQGWNTVWAWTPEDYLDRAQALDEACERRGRDPSEVRRSLGLYTLVGEDERDLVSRYRALQDWMPGGALDGMLLEDWARDKLVGTPERIVERLASFAAAGVEEIILSPSGLPFAIHDPTIVGLFAETVLPKTRDL